MENEGNGQWTALSGTTMVNFRAVPKRGRSQLSGRFGLQRVTDLLTVAVAPFGSQAPDQIVIPSSSRGSSLLRLVASCAMCSAAGRTTSSTVDKTLAVGRLLIAISARLANCSFARLEAMLADPRLPQH
ncbi:hypothetical protein PVAR5_4119 [Paecilomyces variotii No. 5]|uniref:Uncharacterized protein n=1 Tax=Byssochlamys spectabilis (strain No. 5 / NBRC 109023) TaxID=1356009 RepID=V5G0H3_BYSSN|nr:hypothetical protein PVAR5_4119 [Paecilomyces variotii No. 5]